MPPQTMARSAATGPRRGLNHRIRPPRPPGAASTAGSGRHRPPTRLETTRIDRDGHGCGNQPPSLLGRLWSSSPSPTSLPSPLAGFQQSPWPVSPRIRPPGPLDPWKVDPVRARSGCGAPLHSMQFSSHEARRSRARAPGLLNDDSEAQPWPPGRRPRRATAAPPPDGRSPAPPLVLVLVCVQARLSVTAAACVACISAHEDEKYVPRDSAVLGESRARACSPLLGRWVLQCEGVRRAARPGMRAMTLTCRM
ncbi:hypothetical protein VPH35_098491 [Triticum aestivum]